MSSLFRVTFAVRVPHDYSSSDADVAARRNPYFWSWTKPDPNAPAGSGRRTGNAGAKTDEKGWPWPKDDYRRDARTVLVLAASQHPADLILPLSNNVTLLPNEQIEILAANPVNIGEGLLQ